MRRREACVCMRFGAGVLAVSPLLSSFNQLASYLPTLGPTHSMRNEALEGTTQREDENAIAVPLLSSVFIYSPIMLRAPARYATPCFSRSFGKKQSSASSICLIVPHFEVAILLLALVAIPCSCSPFKERSFDFRAASSQEPRCDTSL